MARYIDKSNPYHTRAAAIYDAEGMAACMAYLHMLVRSRYIDASQASHIIMWTASEDDLHAWQGGADSE